MIPGQRFGAYLLKDKIAQGGMAEIFYAERTGAMDFSRPVCIKRIRPALCTEPSFVQMFIDEARTSSYLRHGNIISVEDFGQVDGQLYLAMEWVHGVDTSRLGKDLASAGAPMPVEVAMHIVERVLAGLEYAHGKVQDGQPLEIVHRDISPHNVLVSFAGDIKLTDFGIAKATSRLHRTLGDVVKGKLAYMAPEQARGVADLDGRADLFAVGVMAFEFLTGRRPFMGNEGEIVAALISGRRPTVRSLRPDLPPLVEAFVDSLLQPERELRPSSASAAIDAMQDLGVPRGDRSLRSLLGKLYPDKVSVVTPTPPVRAVSAPFAVPVTTGEIATTEADRRSMTGDLPTGPTGTDAMPRASLPDAGLGTAVLRSPPVAPVFSPPLPVAAGEQPSRHGRAARNVALVLATMAATTLALVVGVQFLAAPVAAPTLARVVVDAGAVATPVRHEVRAQAPDRPRVGRPVSPPLTAPVRQPVEPTRAPSVPASTVRVVQWGEYYWAGSWRPDNSRANIPRGAQSIRVRQQSVVRTVRVNVVPGQTIRLVFDQR